MTTITTARDVMTWVCNAAPGNCVEAGTERDVADAILAADHPLYGEDWTEWLDANAERIALGAMGNNVLSIDDDDIRALQREAGEAGDRDMVAICLVALDEYAFRAELGWDLAECSLTRDEARAECARVIAEAAAQAD